MTTQKLVSNPFTTYSAYAAAILNPGDYNVGLSIIIRIKEIL